MSKLLRPSLCISQPRPGIVIHQGDEDFEAAVHTHYDDFETVALEQLVQLKKRLLHTPQDVFLHTLCDGLARMTDAQYVFVSKRIEESPALDEANSCLMALCWFWNHGDGVVGSLPDITYHAYSCPCAHMKHQKILLIPEKLNEFTPNNPNSANLPIPGEAYIAVPLFDHGKCIAHLGLMWSKEGLERKKLGWGFVEMILHAVEDIVLDHILQGAAFPTEEVKGKDNESVEATLQTLRALHSLKPFARNLSHELRTPMQGIVGMLDVMHATLQDAARTEADSHARGFMEQLKDYLDVIQESSRRAIEAADNVVQAYSLNMGLPEMSLPTPPAERRSSGKNENLSDSELMPRSKSTPVARGTKRRRNDYHPTLDTPNKTRYREPIVAADVARKEDVKAAVHESEALQDEKKYRPSMLFNQGHGVQRVNIRDLISYVVNESLKTGGRLESAVPTSTGEGQSIEVEARISSGAMRKKTVDWGVDASVPELVQVDERDLAKMISCVFQNALKFTNSGRVHLHARFCEKRQCILIVVRDTGPGIPDHFKSRIFKPFAREDDSTTRQSEGLGLGLLVAKGLSRKIGGDLVLISSDTSGEHQGCSFEMRIPISPDRTVEIINPASTEVSFDPDTSSNLMQNDTKPHPSAVNIGTLISGAPPSASRADILGSESHTLQSPPRSPSCLPCASNNAFCPPPTIPTTPARRGSNSVIREIGNARPGLRPSPFTNKSQIFDRELATSHPLTFLVAEDNDINRKLLVNMLTKLGYDPKTQIYEAYDGVDAVRQVQSTTQRSAEGDSSLRGPIDVVLMDLWMPAMDGYEAAERILGMFRPRMPQSKRSISDPDGSSSVTLELEATSKTSHPPRGMMAPTILAITADATDGAAERAMKVGMQGFMVKPFRVKDLERLIREGWVMREKTRAMSLPGMMDC